MKKIIKSPSSLTIFAMALAVVLSFNYFKGFKENTSPFMHDAEQYHSYLVAKFIHDDLTFSFPHPYWVHRGPKDILINKFTLGVALLEMPFFIIGHKIAQLTDYEVDGYSAPYSYSASIGVLIYVFLALCLLRKVLLNYFSEFSTSLTLICLFLGTNLHYYSTSECAMSHSYLFFLSSLILYFAWKWNQTENLKYLYASMFFCGFATILRPTNAICVIIPILFGVSNLPELWTRLKVVIKTKIVVGSLLFFILATLPQLFYWKWATGSFIYYSYSGERFFFDDPKIFGFLFSFTKGWFTYTPVMFIAFASIFIPAAKSVRVLNLLFMSTIIYVLSCWWCWWYGGSYGMRAMIEYYPLLSIPLASFFQILHTTYLKKTIAIALTIVFASWNIIGEIKYKNGVICWDGMTYESYTYGLFKTQFNHEERNKFQSLLYFIDAEGAKKGRRD